MASRKENVVMFPFMSQSHIIPYLALALRLEQEKGYAITFISTPQFINKLQSQLPHNSSIRLIEIPFNGADHGLPPNSQSTDNLPPPLVLRFIQSSLSMKPAFTQIISILVQEQNGTPPLCLISDMFFAWSAQVTHRFGIFHALYFVSGGYSVASLRTLWLNTVQYSKDINFVSDDEFSHTDFPKFHVDRLLLYVEEVPEICNFMDTSFQDWEETDAMLFNTMEEIDGAGLSYLRKRFSRHPIWAIGPSISISGSRANGGKEAEKASELCIQWLDSKPQNSVLYVGFGSQWTPSVSQTKHLAEALEVSGINFLWVARRPNWLPSDNSDWLPEGFLERIKESNKGLVVIDQWVFQMEILSHKSIGAFLNHCGWNTVLEALSYGIPILSWPLLADNRFNSKMLEDEIGVCLELGNGRMECKFQDEETVKKMKLIMNEEGKGKEMRAKACEIKEIIKNAWKDNQGFKGSSVKALDEFLAAALKRKKLLCKLPE